MRLTKIITPFVVDTLLYAVGVILIYTAFGTKIGSGIIGAIVVNTVFLRQRDGVIKIEVVTERVNDV